jgi:hypothetical protein
MEKVKKPSKYERVFNLCDVTDDFGSEWEVYDESVCLVMNKLLIK